jgi:hypothetical protein
MVIVSVRRMEVEHETRGEVSQKRWDWSLAVQALEPRMWAVRLGRAV